MRAGARATGSPTSRTAAGIAVVYVAGPNGEEPRVDLAGRQVEPGARLLLRRLARSPSSAATARRGTSTWSRRSGQGNEAHARVGGPANPGKSPVWQPGGGLIAYESNRAGNWDIYVTDPDGNERALTDRPGQRRRSGLDLVAPRGRFRAHRRSRPLSRPIDALRRPSSAVGRRNRGLARSDALPYNNGPCPKTSSSSTTIRSSGAASPTHSGGPAIPRAPPARPTRGWTSPARHRPTSCCSTSGCPASTGWTRSTRSARTSTRPVILLTARRTEAGRNARPHARRRRLRQEAVRHRRAAGPHRRRAAPCRIPPGRPPTTGGSRASAWATWRSTRTPAPPASGDRRST